MKRELWEIEKSTFTRIVYVEFNRLYRAAAEKCFFFFFFYIYIAYDMSDEANSIMHDKMAIKKEKKN